jgi:hypothetical protein
MEGMLAGKPFLTASPAGSIQAAELDLCRSHPDLLDASGAGVTLPNGDKIAFQGKIGAPDPRPDAERVTRHLKKGRVIAVAPVQPPKDFSAGSVLERQSSLLRPALDGNDRDGFPEARSFAARKSRSPPHFTPPASAKSDPQVPAMLASLVTNDNPDILATAYAPPAPDYARQSPFSSVLREECPARPLHPAGDQG